MEKKIILFALLLLTKITFGQNYGIVRENFFSTYFDSTFMMNVQVYDSSTIRLGSLNPTSGVVSDVGNSIYAMGISLSGATIDPYSNRYYISSGLNFLTFDLNSGSIINNVPISGIFPTGSFQNFRFNPSDTTIYGMVPNSFFSTYFDSTIIAPIQVLDSTQIRFASLNPTTGQYSIIGNTSYSNLYTLAGNSIDPFQMIYYYSAVDTLIGIDLYTGAQYSAVTIQLPQTAIFENIAYSCADTTIYGLTRQNYITTFYDSLLMDVITIYDSTTFRMSKIDPTTGEVTFISPYNIGVGGNLTGGAFIDPNSMTYYFNYGNQIVGVSLVTGLITSSVTKTYSSNAIAFDMMRSTQNCYGASKTRQNSATAIIENGGLEIEGILYPNPAQNELIFQSNTPISQIEILDIRGSLLIQTKQKTIDVSNLSSGIYVAKVSSEGGVYKMYKFIKN
jgi:hypothetical protein